jgi:hypothetical protein
VEVELERLLVRLMGDSSQYRRMLVEAQGATTEAMQHMQTASAGIQSMTNSMEGWGQSALGIVGQLGIALTGIGIAKEAVQLAASAEDMTVSFGVMVGSAARGAQLVKDLQVLAAQTPYELNSLLQSSQLLLTYGTNVEDVLPTLQALGDVTGGDAMKLQRMTYAMSQVQSQGRMTGHVMREMAMAGFNPAQILAEKMAKDMGISVPKALGRIQEQAHKGGLSLTQVKEAFRLATSEGGRFYKNMEKRSQTLGGLFSTMKDDIAGTLRSLGQEMIERMDLKGWVRSVSDASQATLSFFEQLPPEIKKVGGYLLGLTSIVAGLSLSWVLLGPVVTAAFSSIATTVMAGIAGVKALAVGYQALTTVSTAATASPALMMLQTAGPWLLTAAAIAAVAVAGYELGNALGKIAFGGTADDVKGFNTAIQQSTALNDRWVAAFTYSTDKIREKMENIRNEGQRKSFAEEQLKAAQEQAEGQARAVEHAKKNVEEYDSAWARMTGSKMLEVVRKELEEANSHLEVGRDRVKMLQEELKKLGEASQNEQALQALDKLNEKFETQLATLSMTKTEAEVYKATKGRLTEAEKAHTRELAEQVEVFTAAHKKQEELKKGTDDLVKSLFEEISTAGMTADQIKLWKLEQLGLSGATEQSMQVLMQYAQVANHYKEDLKKGKELMKEVRTPTEVYNDRVKELQQWLKEGAINQVVYNRAMEDAKKKMHDAAGGATHAREELQKLDAVLAGGGEAYARIVEYQQRVFGAGRVADATGSAAAGGGTVSAYEPVVQPIGAAPAGPGTNMLNNQQIQLLKFAVDYLATIAKRPPIQLSGANLK